MTPEHQSLIAATLQHCAARHGWLTRDLSIQAQMGGRDAPMTPAELAQGPLGQGLAAIAVAAEGQPIDAALLVDTIQHVYETLFVPLWGDTFAIPDGFRTTPLGQMIAAAQLRLHDPADLLSLAEAAILVYGETAYTSAPHRLRMRLRTRLERMGARSFADASEPNPQHATRWLRADVLATCDLDDEREG